MNQELKPFWIALPILLGVIMLLCVSVFKTEQAICRSKTKDMGLESRFEPWSGCQVKIASDRWFPLSAVKVNIDPSNIVKRP
jgi:hypothetical protein